VIRYTYRTGRKLGRTIYRQLGTEASDSDELLGMMDTAAFAQHIVRLLNLEAALLAEQSHGMRRGDL
jgi:hypothetical protein